MDNSIFGKVVFNTGWQTKYDIELFEKEYSIIITASAYFEKDSINSNQEISFAYFKVNELDLISKVQLELLKFSYKAYERFVPRELLFRRDGSYALIFDDKDDIDGGIVVCIKPDIKVMSQDEYL